MILLSFPAKYSLLTHRTGKVTRWHRASSIQRKTLIRASISSSSSRASCSSKSITRKASKSALTTISSGSSATRGNYHRPLATTSSSNSKCPQQKHTSANALKVIRRIPMWQHLVKSIELTSTTLCNRPSRPPLLRRNPLTVTIALGRQLNLQ